jgi:hypothetical protein
MTTYRTILASLLLVTATSAAAADPAKPESKPAYIPGSFADSDEVLKQKREAARSSPEVEADDPPDAKGLGAAVRTAPVSATGCGPGDQPGGYSKTETVKPDPKKGAVVTSDPVPATGCGPSDKN